MWRRYVNSTAMLKISQIKGLRGPKYGYAFEPFGFIGARKL